MRTRWILIGLISTAVLALLALVFIPRLLKLKRDSSQIYWPTQSWRTSTPEEQGLDSSKLAEGLQAIQKQNTLIDNLMVIRHSSVLLDAAFYPHESTYLHDLASVTKSFMTTLIGIAADQGKLKLDQPVLSFFPDRTIANRDPRKERLTVRHLAEMKNGFESGCLEGDNPTIQTMQAKPDWVQAALDRKMVSEPGTQFCYDSPGMHLLSAILQKATGLTALQFAQQNLFEPLGIRQVYWRSDPQGHTRGWGDLHLTPGDAAKLGYLWLNNGIWEGKQIVSSAWVKDSVKYHSDFGKGDGYGYGWWLWEGGYGAEGRGGQAVKVVPALNIIVVTTGGGFDYDTEINPHLIAAVVDTNKPLPANPAGVDRLAATLAELRKGPAPQKVGALPDTAQAISGKTYVFGSNAGDLDSLGLDFNDSVEAILHLKYTGSDAILSLPVGLDGIYRPSPQGELWRGYWADSQTFILEVLDIGVQNFRVHFEADRASIESPELGMSFEGQVKKP